MMTFWYIIKYSFDKRMKAISFVIAILPLLIPISSSANDEIEWLQKGNASYEKSDYKQAIHWYKLAAERGDIESQYNLGVMYRNGEGVAQNFEEATHWYKKAAEQGDAQAQHILGTKYDLGEGVTQSFKQAIYWYKKAVEQGNKEAQFNLALMYFYGEGVEQDLAKAFELTMLSAKQGHAASISNVANFYHKGLGVEKSHIESLYWYRKSADKGDADAQNMLGLFYETGNVVSKDLDQAIYWYKKSSAQENTSSLGNLATLYMFKGALKKSEETFARFMESINHQSDESVEYYDDYFVQYISLLIKLKEPQKAEKLIKFHFAQLSQFKKNTYKAHYNKFILYNNTNQLELSRASLLKAISLAPTDDILLELNS
jgi:TPR repeat protein